MSKRLSIDDLNTVPRLGWITSPSPITSLPELATELGLAYIGIKRDDLSGVLLGGTKARKLDYLLAAEPFSSAPRWIGVGGIGSGNSAALTAAAQRLERRLEAYTFWTMVSPGVFENLAYVASGPATLHFYRSRTSLALHSPSIFLSDQLDGIPIIPPGSTNGLGMLGMVRAGLELAEQINAGTLPKPDLLYVPFGSGGTAVGLRMGLALAGLDTTVIAVRVVERLLAGRLRIHTLQRQLASELAKWHIALPQTPTPLVLEHTQGGLGYAIPTLKALAACEKLAGANIPLEPIYTGKAMAALLHGARKRGARNILFWLTVHGEHIPHADNWQSRLPPALARRVAAELARKKPSLRQEVSSLYTRRRILAIGTAGAVALTIGLRISGYPPLEAWSGKILAPWEAHVIRSSSQAFLPPGVDDKTLTDIAANIDRYLQKMPPSTILDVHGMLALIEHGTTPLGSKFHRFTALGLEDREAFLRSLGERGGLLAQAYMGLRNLCLLGYYQIPSTWKALGYEGPRVALSYDPMGPERLIFPAYESLKAKAGELPKGIVQ